MTEPGGGRLAGVVAGARPPGVYRWLSRAHQAAVRRELSAASWGCHILDGRGVIDATRLFDGCADVLAFPAWFGRNWDALADCLADLSWLSGPGHVLLWEHYGLLSRHEPEAWRLAREVFAEAILARSSARLTPLYVLLRGNGPVDNIPAL